MSSVVEQCLGLPVISYIRGGRHTFKLGSTSYVITKSGRIWSSDTAMYVEAPVSFRQAGIAVSVDHAGQYNILVLTENMTYDWVPNQ